MINNQKNTHTLATPLRKRLVIGATSVVAAGALLGVGAAEASAATAQPTPAPSTTLSSTSSSTSSHSSGRLVSLIQQLRADLFQGQISGSRVQALAKRIVDNSALFSALPASLQNDLITLKNAPAADAVVDAQQITSTALSGGYGTRIKNLATDLKATTAVPVSQHPELLAKLPTTLKSDVATLKNSGSPENTLQTLAQQLGALTGTK